MNRLRPIEVEVMYAAILATFACCFAPEKVAVDCGDGRSCPEGTSCAPGGRCLGPFDAGPRDGGLPCPPSMGANPTGSYCVDARSTTVGGAGDVVTWAGAADACRGRGLRLCLEAEREAACPGPAGFCDGPRVAATWEWSAGARCGEGARPRSPCCNAQPGFMACDDPLVLSGYHCCLSLP